MKPGEAKPDTVFRILDRETGALQSSYCRAYCDEHDFTSVEQARGANCHGVYADRVKFKIAKYRVTYELIEDDVDPVTPEEIAASAEEAAWRAEQESAMDAAGITKWEERLAFLERAAYRRSCKRVYDELVRDLKQELQP